MVVMSEIVETVRCISEGLAIIVRNDWRGHFAYCVIMAKYIKSESLEKDVIIDNSISHVAYDDKDCAS